MDATQVKPGFSAVKARALPAVWAQGNKIARGGGVVVTRDAHDETDARIATGVSSMNIAQVMHEDEEWSCDCDARADPCPHVCALASHALDLASRGETLAVTTQAAPGSPGYVVYRLLIVPLSAGFTELHIERVVRTAGEERDLKVAVDAKVASQPGFVGALEYVARTATSRVDVTEEDRAIDKLLGRELRPRLPHEKLHAVLRRLVSVGGPDGRVELDGERVAIEPKALAPIVRIIDHEKGVAIRMDRPNGITRVLAPCVVLKDGDVTLLEGTDLAGDRFERLPMEREIPARELGDFVSGPLGDLDRRFNVRVETDKLPGRVRKVAPRVLFDVALERTSLRVRPYIAYGDPPIARVDGNRLVALGKKICPRDEGAERVLEDQVRHELHLRLGAEVTFDGKDAARMLEALARYGASLEGAAATAAAGPGSARGATPSTPPGVTTLVPRVITSGDDVRIEFDAGDSNAGVDARAVMEAWENGHAIVPVAGFGFAALPREFLEKHAARVRVLLDARDERGRLRAYAAREVDELVRASGVSLPKRIAEMARGLDDAGARGVTELPADLATELRPYQAEGINWLGFLQRTKQGGLLADDMGLGKTLQAMCVLGKGSLVVCPTSVMHNWASEITKFRPSLRHALYHGPKRKVDPNVDVTITSYALLRLDAEELGAATWSTVVLDEAQNIKNADSQASRAARALKADFRLALTGTPVENRLEELWSALDFACPGLLGTRGDFRTRYAEPAAAGDPRALEALRRRTRPFMLRRTKEEVARDLPPRTDEILYVELDEDERSIYDTVLAATRKEIVDDVGRGKNPLQILEALLRLRQAACHPSLVPGFSRARSSKVDRLSDAITEIAGEGHRALVFSQWTGFLDLVQAELDATQIGYCRLDGSTRDRGGVVEQFQSPDGPPVMLVSLKAGGSGLNLTAADHVFLLDPWWNPAVEEQAADRAHRIGQDKPVFVYRLVAKDTVEERMLALSDRKRRLAEAALEGSGAAASITREDLLALLE